MVRMHGFFENCAPTMHTIEDTVVARMQPDQSVAECLSNALRQRGNSSELKKSEMGI